MTLTMKEIAELRIDDEIREERSEFLQTQRLSPDFNRADDSVQKACRKLGLAITEIAWLCRDHKIGVCKYGQLMLSTDDLERLEEMRSRANHRADFKNWPWVKWINGRWCESPPRGQR